MRERNIVKALLLLFTVLAIWAVSPVQAQNQGPGTEEVWSFPETGHTVTGEFLKAYSAISNPKLIYGFPITEAFHSTGTGRLIQYFEKARFELIPENPAELRVWVFPLGQYLYHPGEQIPLPEDFPTCKYYPETGFRVCYSFLEFFNSNGGIAVFGYPISNFEIQDGRIIQYFQKAVFEWHPEQIPGQRVMLANLGKRYFVEAQEDPRLLAPVPTGNNLPHTILSLRLHAFPVKAVMPDKGMQTVFVLVQDQNTLPVAGAEIHLSVLLPDGQLFRTPEVIVSDQHGIVMINFPFHSKQTGIVEVDVQATLNDLDQKTKTSFRIWW